MTSGWSVRETAPTDVDDWVRLFNDSFGKSKDARTFHWKYRDNPHGAAVARVACDGDGRVVGAYAYVPRRFRRDGERIVMMQASDAMTVPDWRGRGIFTGLDDLACEACGAAGVPLAYAYSGRLSLNGFLRNGWKLIGHAPLWRFVFRSRRGLRRWGRAGQAASAAAPALDVLLGWRNRARLRPHDAAELTRIERFDTSVDELFEALVPPQGLIGERTAEWLNWRYVDTPEQRQEVFGLRRGDRLDAYFVAEWVDGHGYLVDHLARDEDSTRSLLAAFTLLCRERAVEEASALLFEHHPSVPVLRELGYRRPLRNKPFRDVFPFIVRVCSDAARPDDEQMSRWHLADGDRDPEHMSP